ncbi:hypothetical protein C7M84_016112 [Penaeus vannamei]|uniref:Uncharacterized protein n=1 Tax=Penaeus vannamei TaxID=6689 RepID=A0A423SP41_PENVA|nr:hypothetical protein C7M84_016112 [Penaeus vannamei]
MNNEQVCGGGCSTGNETETETDIHPDKQPARHSENPLRIDLVFRPGKTSIPTKRTQKMNHRSTHNHLLSSPGSSPPTQPLPLPSSHFSSFPSAPASVAFNLPSLVSPSFEFPPFSSFFPLSSPFPLSFPFSLPLFLPSLLHFAFPSFAFSTFPLLRNFLANFPLLAFRFPFSPLRIFAPFPLLRISSLFRPSFFLPFPLLRNFSFPPSFAFLLFPSFSRLHPSSHSSLFLLAFSRPAFAFPPFPPFPPFAFPSPFFPFRISPFPPPFAFLPFPFAFLFPPPLLLAFPPFPSPSRFPSFSSFAFPPFSSLSPSFAFPPFSPPVSFPAFSSLSLLFPLLRISSFPLLRISSLSPPSHFPLSPPSHFLPFPPSYSPFHFLFPSSFLPFPPAFLPPSSPPPPFPLLFSSLPSSHSSLSPSSHFSFPSLSLLPFPLSPSFAFPPFPLLRISSPPFAILLRPPFPPPSHYFASKAAFNPRHPFQSSPSPRPLFFFFDSAPELYALIFALAGLTGVREAVFWGLLGAPGGWAEPRRNSVPAVTGGSAAAFRTAYNDAIKPLETKEEECNSSRSAGGSAHPPRWVTGHDPGSLAALFYVLCFPVELRTPTRLPFFFFFSSPNFSQTTSLNRYIKQNKT